MALKGMLPRDRQNPEGAGTALSTLVRHPDLTKAFLGFNVYLLFRSSLPARLREVAVLRVAHRRDCTYEWEHHVETGQGGGPDRRRRRGHPARRGHRRARPVGAARPPTNSRRNPISPTKPGPRSANISTSASAWTSSSPSAPTACWPWRSTLSAYSSRTKGKYVGTFPETSCGQLDRKLARTGHRSGRLHRLDRPRAVEARAGGDLPQDVAARRARRAAAQDRQLLHPRDAVGRQRARPSSS